MKTLLAAVLFLVACHITLAQQTEVKDKGTKSNYRKLVEGLVSPNRPIKCNNYPPTISLPPNYDWKAQEQIEKNRRILFDHCEEALPFLLEGCTDARYSLMSKWSEDEDFYTWSVGRVCSEIISRHVEAFREHIRFSLPRHHEYNFVPMPHGVMTEQDKKEIQEWWRGRKAKSLHDLQLEAFNWAIEKRKSELKRSRDAEGEKAGAGELKSLVSSRDKLRQSNKCLPSGVMWQSLLSPPEGYTVVPWTEKGE
jgi:hypothetical protein